MYSVYIIQSEKKSKYYIGHTSNIVDRLKHHNSGANKSTRYQAPWRIVHEEQYATKQEVWLCERQIKSYKGGSAFKKLLANGGVA